MATYPIDPPDAALLADWLTIWHSEWAAITVDQEMREASQRVTAAWAAQAQAAVERLAADAAAARPARPAPPPRAPAVADAPAAGLDGRGAEPCPEPASGPQRP